MKKIITAVIWLFAGLAAGYAAPASNTVEIVFNGATAIVSVAANISNYITDKSNGSSHVKLIQSASVNDAVGEISYILSGSSDDGEFYLEGTYKATVELDGLTLTNPSGPAINIQDGKRIKVKVNEGTVNTISDGKNDTYNGCLHVKGHTEFRGKGTLNVVHPAEEHRHQRQRCREGRHPLQGVLLHGERNCQHRRSRRRRNTGGA